MAAFNPVSPKPGQVVSISQCPVCCNEYHPEECVPRLLRSCGHTFCETCLAGLRKTAPSSSVVRCPSCRVETPVEAGKGATDSFPKNYALLENIENVKVAAAREAATLTTEKCEICSERQAQFGCIECETKYCEGCWELCHKSRSLRSHEKVSPGDVFEAKCPNHPSKTADLVCLEPSCPAFGGLICLLCEKTVAHKGHLTEPIEQVADDKRKQLRLAISNAQKNVDFALSVLVKVQEADELLNGATLAGKGKEKGAADNIQSNREKALVIIDRTFRQLMAALEQRRAALIEQVGTLVKTKSEKLEKQRTELCTFLSRSYTRLQDATQALNRTNDRLFMASFRTHHDLLEETTSTELFSEPVVTPLVDIVFTNDLMPEITSTGILNDIPVLQYRRSKADIFCVNTDAISEWGDTGVDLGAGFADDSDPAPSSNPKRADDAFDSFFDQDIASQGGPSFSDFSEEEEEEEEAWDTASSGDDIVDTPSTSEAMELPQTSGSDSWKCASCEAESPAQEQTCTTCFTPKPTEEDVSKLAQLSGRFGEGSFDFGGDSGGEDIFGSSPKRADDAFDSFFDQGTTS